MQSLFCVIRQDVFCFNISRQTDASDPCRLTHTAHPWPISGTSGVRGGLIPILVLLPPETATSAHAGSQHATGQLFKHLSSSNKHIRASIPRGTTGPTPCTLSGDVTQGSRKERRWRSLAANYVPPLSLGSLRCHSNTNGYITIINASSSPPVSRGEDGVCVCVPLRVRPRVWACLDDTA